MDGNGKPFNLENYYYVVDNSKFFGAVILRYRAEGFKEIQHIGGVSPAWPICYEELEPWYQKAEIMYQVCGDASQDSAEPSHSNTYIHTPILHKDCIEKFVKKCKKLA